MLKRILCVLLCLLMLAAAPLSAAAADADSVPKVVLNLMKKFPHLAYWNHVGSPVNNPDGVTGLPCPTHVGCSWEPGACSCNSFSNAIQCMGFAYKAGFEMVGSDPRSWEMSDTLDASKLRVGDVIRYRGNRHSLAVTGVRGNVISFVDCNWYPMCQIRWGYMDLNDMPSFTYVLHDPKNHMKNRNVTFFDGESRRPSSQNPDVSTPETPAMPDGEVWQTTGNMNLRKNTSTESAVIGSVPEGSRVAVEKKKLNNGYLWGKVTYGRQTGWIALDHCNYLSGATDMPRFKAFPAEVAVKVDFTLSWTEVSGADSYTVTLYNSAGKNVRQTTVTDASAKFNLNESGSYTAEVESRSKHAESWVLRSGKIPFAVKAAKDIQIESISLNQTSLRLEIGQTARLISSILPEGAATDHVAMFSGNPAVVTVDSTGLVRAVGFGETMIACSDARSGRAAVCTVKVTLGAPKKLIQHMSKIRLHSITLKWTAVPGAQSYQIFRKSGSDAFRQIATSTENLFTDEGLQAGTTYIYKVRACTSAGGATRTGGDSPILTAATRPEAPEKLKFATKDGKVKVIWTGDKSADHFCVYRSATGKANSFKKIATVKGKNNYLLRGQTRGKVLYFKVVTVKVVDSRSYASRLSKTFKVKVK